MGQVIGVATGEEEGNMSYSLQSKQVFMVLFFGWLVGVFFCRGSVFWGWGLVWFGFGMSYVLPSILKTNQNAGKSHRQPPSGLLV